MKALTISQLDASLIASGEKWIENRSWYTDYRGPLAIHAGKGTQLGYVVAIATLAACQSLCFLRTVDPHGVICSVGKTVGSILSHEHAKGPWLWILMDIRKLDPPIRAAGKKGLWEWYETNFTKKQ